MTDIDAWLQKRTFHHSDFSDLKSLMARKEKLGLSISLCIPTLNEADTIAKEIVLLKAELMDRYPLLDEMAVVDSGSTDETISLARNFGARVFLASECLPEEGARRGKGENLWKALYLLKGDIIIYLDADIRNIHPKFVYGLVGPMLFDPRIKFVKAFYDRPIETEKGIRLSGGGRVTEILIRPLFARFFPELTGVLQPLSGEYAGYRSVFERLPFPIGYGVETGMLIDVYQKWGLDVIAQTDLDQRIHRNHPTKKLGKMSFGILQTFWNRLSRYENLGNAGSENFHMRQVERNQEGFYMNELEIKESERRPIIEVPAYREKFNPNTA